MSAPRGGEAAPLRPLPRAVAVYCASRRRSAPAYLDAAERLGRALAGAGIRVFYGGGATGLMGRVASAALAAGGHVVGVIPESLFGLELAHPGLSETRLVGDMHERKRTMLDPSEGVVALPGGCGTFEELLEAITWKRLGLYVHPIVIVNPGGYYDPLLALLERSIEEEFMDPRHRDMWTVVDDPDAVLGALRSAPDWSHEARRFATV